MSIGNLCFRLALCRGSDHDQLGLPAFAGDAQVERAFFRTGIVGVVFLLDFAGCRRAGESKKLFLFFAKVEGFESRIPKRKGSAERSRPFQLEVALENDLQVERLRGFHVDDDDRARFAYGDEKGFANGKSISGVEDRVRFRTYRKRASERF